MNYRKKYRQHYGIDFSNDYVVHHIDLDRSNNDIDNLLLLPKQLHSKYHFYLTSMRSHGGDGFTFHVDGRIRPAAFESWYLTSVKRFAEALDECAKWYDYKLYLDGYMPNVHGIEID